MYNGTAAINCGSPTLLTFYFYLVRIKKKRWVKNMAATLRDISKRTGVSLSTVSKALRGSPEVSTETIELVKKVALELRYQCKNTNWRTSRVIGVILPEVSSHYFAELCHSIGEQLEKRRYSMLLMLGGFTAEGISQAYQRMLQQNISGIIISVLKYTVPEIRLDISESSIPTVLFSEGGISSTELDNVYINCNGGIQLAVNHLQELGHKKIGYIGDVESTVRMDALSEVLRERGLPLETSFMKLGSERFELGGYLRMRELLAEEKRPTAVIAGYDQVAFGAMRAIAEAGLRVPEDISILGIDNVVLDEYMPITITSIMNPTSQVGVIAVKLLLDKIQSTEDHIVQNVALQCKLVERSSTGPVPIDGNCSDTL